MPQKGATVSGYSCAKVKRALWDALESRETETACHWLAELILSEKVTIVWDLLITYVTSRVSIASPKCVPYMARRLDDFKDLVSGGGDYNDYKDILIEAVCILSHSPRRPPLQRCKMTKPECFSLQSIRGRMVPARDIVLSSGDPADLRIPTAQLYEALAGDTNLERALYWIEWFISYDCEARKKKSPLVCSERENGLVPLERRKDVVWLTWEIIETACSHGPSQEYLGHLKRLFSSRYSATTAGKRWQCLYAAAELVLSGSLRQMSLVPDPSAIGKAVKMAPRFFTSILSAADCQSSSTTQKPLSSAEEKIGAVQNLDRALRLK